MRLLNFAKRNLKEIIRDPLNLSFLFGFPIVLLLLLTAIQANIPVSMFEIADECYAVGNAVESLKQIATAVIDTNDRDGVAKWLLENATK